MEEIQKQNKEELTTEYTRNFFQGTLDKIKELSDSTEDNPAEFNMMCTATIDGISSEIPQEDMMPDTELFKIVEKAITKDKAQKQVEKQVAAAKENNDVSVQRAYQSAVKSAEDGDPLALQAARSAIFLDTVDSEVSRGRMSEKLARSTRIEYAKDIMMKNMTAALLSPNTSVENKGKMVNLLLNGHTGEDAWDKYMSPTEKAEAVLQILGVVKNIDNYNESNQKAAKEARALSFEAKYREYLTELATMQYSDSSRVDEIKQDLYRIAPPEDFEKIANIEDVVTPKKTSPIVMIELDKAKKDGNYNSDLIYDLVSRRILVGEDAKKALQEAASPLGVNLNSTAAKVAIANAKHVYDYSDTNQAEWQRWYAGFQSRIGDRVMTEAEIRAVANEAQKDAAPIHSTTKEQAEQKAFEEGKKIGIPIKQLNQYRANAIQEADGNTDYNVIAPKIRQKVVENIKYQQSIGQPIVLYDADGNQLSDKDIIDIQMSKVKEMVERMQ